MGVGTGHAKLLLLGEHAAVHGHPAVGLALPWTLSATHIAADAWNESAWGADAPHLIRLIGRLSELALERGLRPPVPGTVEIRSEIVPSGGFGSSAALCAALVETFFPELEAPARDELAWRAEFLFHGTPSGIDTALAFRQGWWALDPGTPGISAAQPRALPDPGLTLVVGSVERGADTKSLVASISRRVAAKDTAALDSIARLGSLAREAVSLISGAAQGLPRLVAEARDELRSLNLETPDLTAVLDAGLACRGAQAGKLSGAGGGGAFLVLFENRDSAEAALGRVRAAIPRQRWKAFPAIVP